MHTIATSDCLNKFTIDISQRDRESIVFHLTAHLEILASQALLHTLIPVGHVLFVVGVGQREHGVFVLHLRKFGIQVATHTLGR